MTTLRIDTEAHVVEFSAELLGEPAPVEGKFGYRLEDHDGALTLVPTSVEFSRPWLDLLAKQLLADDLVRLPIPGGLVTTLARILRL